jgi:hypothetical protein
MAGLKVFKELELPQLDEIQLNSIYLIGNSNSSHVDIYITGNTPGIIKRVRNEEDINDLIDNKLSNFSLSDPIVFAGTLDLNIVNTGPTRLNSLFIVQNDYNEFKQNDLLLKISDTSPYFVKLNNFGFNSNDINAAIDQVRTLAQANELKIGTKADQIDLENTQIQVEQNRLSILTKADIQALALLTQLVDTKADQSYVNQQIANLVGSAPEALNTVYELATAIQNEQSIIDSLNQSVTNRVRFDIATQALTEIQKQNARTNIDAEKVGTAQQLVSQITATSIGAATSAQGAKADTALQSADVAPVALSGLFSSLGDKNKIFDVVFGAYALGSNDAITATDTLGQMLGKLQAQINNSKSSGGVTWVKANTVGTVHPSIPDNNNFIEFAKINGMLWIRGFFKNTNYIQYDGYPHFFLITDNSYKIIQRITPTSLLINIPIKSIRNVNATIAFLTNGKCIDASTTSTSNQYFSLMGTTLYPPSDFYYIPPTCLGELVIK